MKVASPPKSGSMPLGEIYGDRQRITVIFYWFIIVILAGLIAGIFILLPTRDIFGATIIAISILPVLASLFFIRHKKFEMAASFLALVLISLITVTATLGLGIHHISVLGYPAILIVSSLVTRKRVMVLLTSFAILCVAWLVFGELSGIYTPDVLVRSLPGDFFSVSILLIMTAIMVRLISESLFRSTHELQRELHERKLAEQQREALIKQLEAKNAELERFTYTVSHDLKAPLVTINGFIGYLEGDAASGNMDRFKLDRQRIQEAVNRMQLLLNDLLELSRIGRLLNPQQALPFGKIVDEAVKLVAGRLEANRVTVQTQPDLPAIHGDPQRLTEVMQNLLDNAAKFMGDQPHPSIEIGQQGEEQGNPVLFVRDNGIGIAPEYHERIFGLFNKLNPAAEGTGVGLALVKRIIEFHGGRIWVESEAGRGSTFYFTLPVT